MSCALQSWQDEKAPAYKCIFAALSCFAFCQTLHHMLGSLGLLPQHQAWKAMHNFPRPILQCWLCLHWKAGDQAGICSGQIGSFLFSANQSLVQSSLNAKERFLTDVRKFWSSPWGKAGLKDTKYNLMFLFICVFVFQITIYLWIYLLTSLMF